jgi:hypothetical protein
LLRCVDMVERVLPRRVESARSRRYAEERLRRATCGDPRPPQPPILEVFRGAPTRFLIT